MEIIRCVMLKTRIEIIVGKKELENQRGREKGTKNANASAVFNSN